MLALQKLKEYAATVSLCISKQSAAPSAVPIWPSPR